MSRALFSLFIASMACGSAFADLQVVPAVSVSNGIPTWMSSFRQRVGSLPDARERTECAPTKELSAGYLCMSFEAQRMNLALTRASLFVEGNGGPETKGVLALHNDPTVLSYLGMIGGHDLRAQDLVRFYKEVQRKCAEDARYCANAEEKEFFDGFILPQARKNPEMVLITFGVYSHMSWDVVVTHEIMHAQYFLQPAFAKVVDDYWAAMPESARGQVRDVLAEHYDRTDEFLMKNEFQAYILMYGAERSELGFLVGTHRDALMAKMKAAGVQPIQVSGR